MSKILDMPKLSPTMEEGVLSAWHKAEGDAVEVDDLLADVETDKATMEFRAFDKGVLLKLLVPAGATVKLGQPVAIVGAAGEDISGTLAKVGGGAAPAGAPEGDKEPRTAHEEPSHEEPSQEAPPHEGHAEDEEAHVTPAARESYRSVVVEDDDDDASTKTALLPPRMPGAGAAGPPTAPANVLDRTAHLAEGGSAASGAERRRADHGHDAPPGEPGRVLASPYVRKAAREMGVDLAGAHGSGPGGRVVATDLDQMREDGAPTLFPAPMPAPPPQRALARASALREPDVYPLSMMRKTIARRLTESKQTVPHFYLKIDVEVGALVDLREDINAELREQHAAEASSRGGRDDGGAPPLKVSLNDLIVKACALGLVRVPACNAEFTKDAILHHRRVDISVAVAVPDGLVTPVVRNADQKSVVAIAQEIRELAARARSKKLSLEEMSHGTFSISNLGMFGVDEFAAVINPPEGAILAVGQVREAPVVKDGAVVAGKMLALTLSCDHRVVDGAVGASFLAELRALLTRPMRILTG